MSLKEREGGVALGVLSLRNEDEDNSSSRWGGNVEIGFIDFHISSPRRVHVSGAEPEFVEEFCFGLLHAPGGFGVAVRGGHAFEGVEA